jgi:hypothetical protein
MHSKSDHLHSSLDPSTSSSIQPSSPSHRIILSSSSPLDPLNASTLESLSKISYRLAGSASGTSRSGGRFLDEAAGELAFEPDVDPRDPESLKEFARRYRERTERALALERAAIEYNDAVREAGVVRRRIERKQEALRRRAERKDLKENRRTNRPVHVDVNPAAWNAVKRDAFRNRRTVGDTVGELVLRSVQGSVIPRRRPHQTSTPRFARLFVDEETWAQFRALAFDANVSIGRLVGMLVESEAWRLHGGDEQ